MTDAEQQDASDGAGSEAIEALLRYATSQAVKSVAEKGNRVLQRRLNEGIVQSAALAATQKQASLGADAVQRQVKETLAAIETMTEGVLKAQEEEKSAIETLLEKGGALGDLGVASATQGPSSRSPSVATQMTMDQIARTLRNIIKQQADDSSEQKTAPMQKTIEEMQDQIDLIQKNVNELIDKMMQTSGNSNTSS